MKQAKLLFLLRNDLASTSQRIIIEISEDICHYLLFKYCRDVAADVAYPTGWLKELEKRFEQIRCDDLSVFYNKTNE